MRAFHHAIGHRHRDLAREMVVAGADAPERLVARTDDRRPSLRRRGGIRGHRHDALQHARDGRRGEPVVAVTTLTRHGQQPRLGQPRQVSACGLRGNTGGSRELGGRQRTTIHQRREHIGAGGVADQSGGLGKGGAVAHRRPPAFEGEHRGVGPQDATALAGACR
jgi:hypothetical protein